MDGIPNFEENFNVKTTAEIEEMLSNFLAGESGGEGNTSETTKYNNNEASDVDAAFKELLS